MKTFVIGDVHGCFNQLRKLLEGINPDLKQDRLIMLGDYIDRGPDSYMTLRKLIHFQKEFGDKHVVLLRGNHEQMAIDYLHNPKTLRNWSWNGGESTLKDFQKYGDVIANYESFFLSLPLYFEDEHFIYVHGGIRQGLQLSEQKKSDLLWLREEFFLNTVIEKKPVIFGHTPTQHISGLGRPYIHLNRIGIDTGCVYEGYLSALELKEGEIKRIIQVGRKASA